MFDVAQLNSWLSSRPLLTNIHRRLHAPGKDSYHLDREHDAIVFHDYPGEMWLGEKHYVLSPGNVSFIPCGTNRIFRSFQSGQHRVLNFSGGALKLCEPFLVGGIFLSLCLRFDESLRIFSTSPSRCEVKVWDLLWDLCEQIELGLPSAKTSILVRQALQEIELHLSEKFSAGKLARELGVSASHLSRLFTKETGMPMVRWAVGRRMNLAKHLLTETTLSVGEVAKACGMPDPQWFNKTVRRELGKSPSSLRGD
jgi:AraC-like DNA-binding protein